MIRFRTESGSIYDVDDENNAWRAPGGEWKTFEIMSPVVIGLPVSFVYGDTYRRTSAVVAVGDDV